MKLDEVRRNTIEARKEAELLEERHTLNSWKHELDKKQETDLATKDDTIGKSFTHKELLHEWDRVGIAAMEGDAEKTLIRKEGSAPVVQQNQKVEPKGIVPAKIATLKSGERILPAPRRSFKVFIAFTPKVLPNHLPARQSREKQLQLKKHSPVSNDVIDVSEREPLFLQDKGDKFYSGGDYPSAINAYTDAIRKDASLILCYANRAACYLQMNQMQACIGDCTRVVELLGNQVGGLENNVIKAEDNKPVALSTSPKPIGINKDFLPMETLDLLTAAKNPAEASEWNKRVKSCILSRRGCAKAHLRDFADALVDLREALAIDSSNTDIHRVLGTIATELY